MARRTKPMEVECGGSTAMPERVRTAVLELGGSLAAMVDALPQIRRAADLEKALELQTPLAWRVYRLSQAADAATAIEYLPTVKQLERVVARAAREVPERVAERASAAVERFATLVEEVGGDQRGFESLASGLAPVGVKRVELEHRRSAFKGNAHLWGMQARCLAACAIERPGAAGLTRDGMTIRGMLDLQTSRADVPLVVQTRSHFTAVKSPAGVGDQTAALTELPAWRGELELLAGFGGPRLPEMYTEQTEDGWQQTMARVPGIGRAESVSFYLRQAYRGAVEDRQPGLGMLVEIPAQWLHLEYLVPTGWTSPTTARLAAFANRHDVKRAYECRATDRIGLHEPVQHFAGRENVPATSEMPHWPEAVRHVLVEQGWWGMKFDVYRCVIPFPMLHAWAGMLTDAV